VFRAGQGLGGDHVDGGDVDVVLPVDDGIELDRLALGGRRRARELAADLSVFDIVARGIIELESEEIGKIALDQVFTRIARRFAADRELDRSAPTGHCRKTENNEAASEQ